VFQDKKEVSAKSVPQRGMQKCIVMVEKPIQLIPFFRLFLPCFPADGVNVLLVLYSLSL